MEKTKKKVMIVEDNFMNRTLAREILTLRGYATMEAKSGAEAVTLLNSLMPDDRPDIILMDLHLPEMDGFTAMRIIKANEQMKDIPILALTASAMRGDEEKILGMGFDGYVAKPIDVKRLAAAVAESLNAKKRS